MTSEPVVPAIIRPEIGCLSFEAGGVVYTRTESLSLGRARLLQRFQTELQFDTTIPGVQQTVAAIIAHYNTGKEEFEAKLKVGQLRDKLDLIGANRFRQAEVAGLFYNAPDEDPTTYNHAAFQDKVYKKWAAVDADFFTHAAFGLLLRTSTRYPLLPNPAAVAPTEASPSPPS